jgi:hypothetical protein
MVSKYHRGVEGFREEQMGKKVFRILGFTTFSKCQNYKPMPHQSKS